MIITWINLYVQSIASEYIQMKTMIYYSPQVPQMGSLHIILATVKTTTKSVLNRKNLRSATGTLPSPTFDVANNNVHDYSLRISPTYNLNT